MRRIILFSIIVCIAKSVSAQTIDEPLAIENFRIEPVNNNVEVTFNINTTKKIVGSNYFMLLTPEIINGSDKAVLPSIMIEGRSASISRQRQAYFSENDMPSNDVLIIKKGNAAEYKAVIPYGNWMEGADVKFSRMIKGCCKTSQILDLGLASNIMIVPTEEVVVPPVEIQVPPVIKEPQLPEPTFSTGNLLTKKYSFVTHDSLFTNDLRHDKNSTVYFKQAKYEIGASYLSNKKVLDDISDAIRTLAQSSDCQITRIIVAGYTSPEGTLVLNEKLGQKRAEALKQYVLSQSNQISQSNIEIYNGVTNWDVLKELITKSDMKEKKALLDIINNTPIWDSHKQVGRLGQLMRFKGGTAYRYILNNFFPELRSASYIKIYYKNK